MNTTSENETWIIETGNAVIQKKATGGVQGLSARERLIYCLWVADYGMRNAGDLDTARDLFADFQQEGARLAGELSLPFTRESFSLSKEWLEKQYFERFEGICDEIRRTSADVENVRAPLPPHISVESRPPGSADSERAKALARPRTILIAIAASFPVVGLIEPHLPNAGEPFNATAAVHALVLAMLLFAWCRADAIARRVRRPAGATLLVAFIAPIGIPYYFFRTMPWRMALVATAKAIGFYIGTTALFFATYYLSS